MNGEMEREFLDSSRYVPSTSAIFVLPRSLIHDRCLVGALILKPARIRGSSREWGLGNPREEDTTKKHAIGGGDDEMVWD